MNKIILIGGIFFFCAFQASTQNLLNLNGEKVRDNKLYLFLESGKLKYFLKTGNQAGSQGVEANEKFSLDGRSCNIYGKWMNPLRYEIKWSDSIFVDERDLVINSLITNLVAQAGAPVATLNQDKKESKAALAKAGFGAPDPRNLNELQYPPDGFKAIELTDLYIMLRDKLAKIPQDIATMNSISKTLIALDQLNGENFAKEAEGLLKELFKYTKPSEVDIPAIKTKLTDFEQNKFSVIEQYIKDLSAAVAQLKLSDTYIQLSTKDVINKFLQNATKNLSENRELTKKFDPVVEILENSLATPGDVPNTTPSFATEFYKLREINVPEGKGIHSALTLIENDYDSKKIEFKKKTERSLGSMQFRRYDPIMIFASVGGFWSNTTLRSYGVDEDLKVVEDGINKDNFVPAAFVNFCFVPSRYLTPLIQLGVDPTKKRPFLLLGGGLAVPSARFSLSGGGIWTWEPRLNKLTVDQKLNSTNELEEDISYKFSMHPRGWYLGIQYNF